jgi:hypothetical protein
MSDPGYMRAVTVLFGPNDRLGLCFERLQHFVRMILNYKVSDRLAGFLALGPRLDIDGRHDVLSQEAKELHNAKLSATEPSTG